MTREQEILTAYVNHHTNYLKMDFEGSDILKVKDKQGNVKRLSINLYSDIIDVDARKVITVSDLPHDLDRLGCQLPRKWENC